eukprot:9381933-Heterocapsa_arctica.AAC.1
MWQLCWSRARVTCPALHWFANAPVKYLWFAILRPGKITPNPIPRLHVFGRWSRTILNDTRGNSPFDN